MSTAKLAVSLLSTKVALAAVMLLAFIVIGVASCEPGPTPGWGR